MTQTATAIQQEDGVYVDGRGVAPGRVAVPERAAEAAGAADGAFGLNPFVGFASADIRATIQQIAQQALQHPQLALQHATGFLAELGRALNGRPTLAPDPKDRRFLDPAWKENSWYRAALYTYLAWQQRLYAFVDDADLSPHDAERARFVLALLTEALAPTNTLLGNPAALKRAIETGGGSLVRGLIHLLDDIANNGSMPSQVDRTAFQVGKDLALMPGAVVFKNEVLELIQYAPATEQVYCRPLLVVPPQINKFYVLDLAPGKSLIEYALQQGIPTFSLSWRNPTQAQRDWGLETYMRALLKAIDVVRDITASEDINILGACSGGMTLTALLGHLAARGDRRINAATLLVTVLDTSVESQLGLFATPQTIAAAKAASRIRGVLDGRQLARVFNWMRPNDLIWNYWVNNYLLGADPPAFDILYWNNDTTDLPARLHGDLLDMFVTNPFKHSGTLTLLGTPIDLSSVSCDIYLLAGLTDHITPWRACYATTQLVGGECAFVLSNSGHIQSILNPPSNPKATFFTNSARPADPAQWLAGAQQHSGSWWEHWRDWLRTRSGEQRPAPPTLGNAQYTPGAPAPGTYVLEISD
jgi:polyhydroxyalkanoate synthase subunit PhaC